MEGIFLGQAVDGVFSIDKTKLTFEHERRTHESHSAIRYSDCYYVLVESDDVIKTNDELLKLREEVKELKIQINMMEAANADQAKTLLTVIKSRDYFEEKADSVEKKYWELIGEHTKLQEEYTKLEDELAEIKTTRTLREAYITGVEKGCESLREDRDMWKRRWNSVVTDISNTLSANGIELKVKDILGDVNWKLEFDIPELNEAKKKIADLEQKLAAKDRGDHWKRRYDDLAEYWDNSYTSIVATGKKVGVKIEFKGDNPDNNAGDFDITNEKAIELMVKVSDTKHEYNKKWQAMLNALKAKGVKVLYMGEQDGKPIVDVKIPGWEMDKQWVTTFSKRIADLRADKFGLEGERDELKEQCDILRKDYIVRGQAIDDLKKELKELKSKTVAEARYQWKPNCFTIIYTMCDGSKQTADCKDCKHHETAFWRVSIDGEGMATCRSPKTKYGFCRNNCNGEKACPEFEAKE